MTTRRYPFWCGNCPTRVTVETEVKGTSTYPDPEYIGHVDGVAMVRVRAATDGDDGLEGADRCPACASPLHDLGDLVAYGDVPPHDRQDAAAVHAAWLGQLRGVDER